MSEQSTDSTPAALTPRQARLRRQARDRRRRRILLAGGCGLLLIAAVVAVVRNDDSGDDRTARTRSGDSVTTSTPATPTLPPTSAGPGGSSTGSSVIGPAPAGDVVALPAADLDRPPDPPVALYRQGKLFLEGSVPAEAVAASYAAKFRRILGAGNVFVDMKRDPRVPAGPMRVIVQEEYQFPSGSNALDPKYEALLNLGVFALQQLPEARLVLTGYTDNEGPAEVNQSLSEQRSRMVADFMVLRGIPADRIVALGRGPADPIADNATPEGRQRNRRIEATLEGITP